MDSRPLLYSTWVCSFNNQAVEDDTDRLPTNVVFTPAFTRQVPDDDTEGTWYGIQLVHGNADIASMEQALFRACPRVPLATSASHPSPRRRSSAPSNRSPLP